ncbi:integrase [Mesorhizobium sp. M0220]|uniref:integrase n=1 Tax=unclassified Mesorhizobium TaxID=325217 RepID=UPI00333ABA7B
MAVPDEFTLKRSEKLIRFYTQYRAQLDATPIGGRWMPYRWWSLPNPMSARWMPYNEMLAEYSGELANKINDLTHYAHRLRTWAAVLAPLSNEDKHDLTHEFIDMLGTVALGLPYALKSRFTFAAGHLCHQANMTKISDWKDDFPTANLYLNDIEPYCRGWRKYRRFKLKIEPIAGSVFKEQTDDFRNTYNHGFSARFVLGMTRLVGRKVEKSGRILYGIGGSPALDLGEMGNLLQKERDICYQAFDAFRTLVNEQTEAIAAFEAAEKTFNSAP